MFIWRAIGSEYTTLTEVENGVCDLVRVLKINAILDAKLANEYAASQRKPGQ